MKNKGFLVRVQRGGVTIFSADGKTEYAFLRKLKSGIVIRALYEPISGGILAEGTGCSSMGGGRKQD